jgi:hypothetical protein
MPLAATSGDPTCLECHRVKVALYRHFIDGKGFISRMSRKNRHNWRYLPQKCHKIFQRSNQVGHGLAVAEQPSFSSRSNGTNLLYVALPADNRFQYGGEYSIDFTNRDAPTRGGDSLDYNPSVNSIQPGSCRGNAVRNLASAACSSA